METCKNKSIKKIIKRNINYYITRTTKEIKDIKNKLKNETNKDKREELNTQIKFRKDYIYSLKHQSPLDKESRIKANIEVFCNPGCVDTLLQEAEYSEADLEKKFDWCKKTNGCNKKDAINKFKKSRKTLKKGNKKMLKDNFYHAFDNELKKQFIKDGALSGCVQEL